MTELLLLFKKEQTYLPMKVTNNRAKSATFFYKSRGKMQKVRLKPFESLAVSTLNDINAVRNNMVISNFVAKDRAAYYQTASAISLHLVTNYTYNDGLSVSTRQYVDTGYTYTQGNFAAYPYGYSAATPQATFAKRKIPVTRQTKGRFEVKYL